MNRKIEIAREDIEWMRRCAFWNDAFAKDRDAQQIVKEIDSGLKKLIEHIEERQEKTR